MLLPGGRDDEHHGADHVLRRSGATAAANFGIIEADAAGELVADAVADGRFLVLTTDEARDELRERGNDIETYLDRIVEDYT